MYKIVMYTCACSIIYIYIYIHMYVEGDIAKYRNVTKIRYLAREHDVGM